MEGAQRRVGPQAPPNTNTTPQEKTMPYRWTGYWRKPYYRRYGNSWRKPYYKRNTTYRQRSETRAIEDLEPNTKRLDIPRNRFGSTRSSVVKLSIQFTTSLNYVDPDTTTVMATPVQFGLNGIPGFSDYKSVYSKFRVIRGEVIIPTLASSNTTSTVGNYLVVSSQPFAETVETAPDPTGNSGSWVPNQEENALRQARWQRTVYPDSTTTGVRIGFQPYTMVATYGPQTSNVERTWQRIWRGYNWTPFTWVTATEGLLYYGPYILRSPTDDNQGALWQASLTVILYCQFAGQK